AAAVIMTSTAASGGPPPADGRDEQEANETPSPSPTSSEPRGSVSSMAGSYAGDGPSAGLQSLLFAFARTFLCLFPTYLAGYLGMSFSWILLGVVVWLGYKRIRASKKQLLLKGEQLSSFEELCIRSGIKHQDLPAWWVQFPDVERVEWLNKVLVQVWPFFGRYMEGVFRQAIEPAVRGSTDYLKTFTFTKLHFGEKPFKVTGIKTYSQNVDKRQIILDLQISYVGDCDINVEIPKYFCNAGAKQVQLHGSLRVILEPLISQVPFFGALTFFFIRRPQLNINWTGLTNLLDIPGLNNMSDSMITDQIANLMVLPNRFTVPIVGDLELAQLRFPIPKGVLRIHLKGARDLERKDNLLKGMIKGKSDPYTVLHVGPQRFQSKTIQKNLDPIWNEVYEAIVHEVPGQELEATLFDEDPDKDDFLGSLTIDLNEVAKERVVDEWFVLDEVDTGQLHLKLEWLSLLTDASSLNEILGSIRAGPGQANDGLSSALLVVYLDCARNLPPKKKGTNLEPSPFVQLSVSHTTFESKICYNTNDPVWEQPFTFCIHNPTDQDLDIEVKDDDRQCSLGSFNLPLKRLLAADGMTLDQTFQLSNSGPNSVIKMKLALRRIIHGLTFLNKNDVSYPAKYGIPVTWVTVISMWKSPSTSAKLEPRKYSCNCMPESLYGYSHLQGVLRIHLKGARDLQRKDNLLKGMIKGKSDPYTVLHVGPQRFQSKTIPENLHPVWNEIYEAIVHEVPGQELEATLFDEDPDKDDFLGSLTIDLNEVAKERVVDEWFVLDEVDTGQLHLKLEWLSLLTDASSLNEVLLNPSTRTDANDGLSSALLVVYLDCARNLPSGKKGTSHEPSPFVQLSVSHTTFESKICYNTNDPVWEQPFTFCIHNPTDQDLDIEVKDDDRQCSLGSFNLPLKRLLAANGMTLDQAFQLSNSGPNSVIKMKLALRVCVFSIYTFMFHQNKKSHLSRRLAAMMGRTWFGNMSVPASTQELRRRVRQMQDGTSLGEFPLGQIQLTIRHSAQRNQLVVVVHACKNLLAPTDEGANVYVRIYMHPNRRRLGKRKTSTVKKSVNPVFDETLEFTMTLAEAKEKHILDLAVKHDGGFLAKEELLGKLQIDVQSLDLTKGTTNWYDLTVDGDILKN
uniref:Extended synaptotagmin-like protein 1b n=1 Tax=Petromyzon marinus TaxID=7757 RepID=S4RU61_PETMA